MDEAAQGFPPSVEPWARTDPSRLSAGGLFQREPRPIMPNAHSVEEFAPRGASRAPPLACEFARAHLELIGSVGGPETHGACSHEPPEVRSFPASSAGSRSYALCNGHLRDIYTALEAKHAAVDRP